MFLTATNCILRFEDAPLERHAETADSQACKFSPDMTQRRSNSPLSCKAARWSSVVFRLVPKGSTPKTLSELTALPCKCPQKEPTCWEIVLQQLPSR